MKCSPHLAILFNATVWGLIWIPLQWLNNNGISAIFATFLSYLFLMVVLYLFNPVIIKKIFSSHELLFISLFYGLTNVCFNWSITNGDVVRVVFLFYLMPVWAAIFSKFILGESLGLKKICRIFLAFLGLVIVLDLKNDFFSIQKIDSLDKVALLGGVFFALGNVFLKKANIFSSFERSFSIILGSCFVPLSLLLVIFAVNFESIHYLIENFKNFNALSILKILAIILTLSTILGAANFCLQFGGSKLLVQTTSLLMLMEIPIATISYAYLKNSPTDLSVLIGGGFIIVAAVWSSYDSEEK